MLDNLDDCFTHLAYLRKHLRQCEEEYATARASAIPPEVQERLTAIDQEYKPYLAEWGQYLAEAEERLKAAVLAYGRSAKREGYHAVYHEGKVSWDDAFLQGYGAAHEEILQGRREGQPWVSLRREKGVGD